MSETFELEDEPQEPKQSSMSETFDLEDEPEEPKSAREPAKPLARLWKAEPDSTEEESHSRQEID